MTGTDRCAAAHHEDPTPCEGPHDAVIIRDAFMSRSRDAMTEGVTACEHHGSRILASLDGGRVYPGSVEGAATRVHTAADSTRPFAWYDNAPRTRPDQRSHAENRAGAPVFEVGQSGADSDGWDPDDPYGDVDAYENREH